MIYQVLADVIVAIHFAYVAFVVLAVPVTMLGGVLGWQWVRNPWFRGIHLLMILIVVLESWAGITCPLTIWEKDFRMAAGDQSYQGDFIATWLHDAMFFDAPPWVFTLAYTLFASLVIGLLIFVPPRLQKATAPSDDSLQTDGESRESSPSVSA